MLLNQSKATCCVTKVLESRTKEREKLLSAHIVAIKMDNLKMTKDVSVISEENFKKEMKLLLGI